MRTEIPVTHLLQMLGLCHTYDLHKAHYISSSYGQGILVSEIYFKPRLWKFLAPRMKQFCDWWSIRVLPPRMDAREKEEILREIKDGCFIDEINCVTKKRLQQVPPQTEVFCLSPALS